MIEIDRDTLRDFERAASLEWLETDALGGWAGSTLSGAHSRRDHHLLRIPERANEAADAEAAAAAPAAGADHATAPAGPAGPAEAAVPGGAGEAAMAGSAGEAAMAGSAGGTAMPAGAGDTPAATASDTLPGATVALAKLDEMVIENDRVHELSCNRFPFFLAAPGLRYLASFRRDLFPVFEYEAEGYRLRKTVALIEGDGALVVLYEVLAAPGPFVLGLRSFFARREAGALCRADLHGATPAALREPAGLRLRWSSGAEISLAVAAELDERPDWWYRFELEEERRRGRDFQEDLWTPGLLRRELAAGDRFGLVASAGAAAGRDALELLARERRRREKLLDRLPVQDELTRILALAADQFALRQPGGARLASSYPGGEEATADSLIALPGVLLATGRTDEAKKLLRACALAAAGGALPDRLPPTRGTTAAAPDRLPPTSEARGEAGGLPRRLPDASGEAGPAAPDGSLWLFVAAWRYLRATGDEALVRDTLLPALAKIAAGHERGAPNGLRVAADGLLEAAPGSPTAAFRPGKAVEINALWHNALATLADLGGRLGDAAQAKAWGERARRVQRRYAELFWNAAAGCLYDSVPADGDAGVAAAGGRPGAGGAAEAAGTLGATGAAGLTGAAGRAERDPALRAHQVLAIGLPFPALSKQRAQRLLRTLEEKLYTPVGLRDGTPAAEAASAPGSETAAELGAEPAATATAGAPEQGEDRGAGHPPGDRTSLARPWLLGPFLAAQVWLRGEAGRRQALQLVAELDPLLSSGAIGTIAERVGVELPHGPLGHIAHAASVGELLRVYVEELHPGTTAKRRRPPESKRKPKPRPAAGSQPDSRRERGRKATPER
jgi:glycogen debranching enzyme